jgi:2-methylcitrate dehydratase PrpD
MSRMLVEPPAKSAVGMFMTGFTGAMGTAAAVGKLMGLDEQRMMWALAIAATQGAGFRETHGSMSVGFVRAHAARCGLVAALLAEEGFTASDHSLEAPRGFAAYAENANLDIVTRGLGSHYETLGVAYKPYACAIVVHPAIDVAREFIEVVAGRGDAVKSIELKVHPLAVELSGQTTPINANYARISASHWVAATVLKGTQGLRKLAGLDGSTDGYVDDAAVVSLRGRVKLIGDPGLGRDEAHGMMTLADGRVLEAHIEHCRGSLARPMTDDELSEKFMPQALMVLQPGAAKEALEQSWRMYEMPDVGAFAGRLLG